MGRDRPKLSSCNPLGTLRQGSEGAGTIGGEQSTCLEGRSKGLLSEAHKWRAPRDTLSLWGVRGDLEASLAWELK